MTDKAQAYTRAGVNIHAGNAFVSRIKEMVASTFTRGVITDIGGFGGLFQLDTSQMQEPVLVAGADGVGTKLSLAFIWDVHHTIGIDLVAMSVNDVLVQGARPLFFLDYFATGKLDQDKAATVVSGIAGACRESGCALLGGETAEMPDFYKPGEYDLSGFCVGVVDKTKLVDGSKIGPGDSIIGLASSGVHSNGYSLVRRLVASAGIQAGDVFPGTGEKAADVLLCPTALYVKPVLDVLSRHSVHGMCHITGGGFYDNIPRVLPKGLAAHIDFNTWDILPVFSWIKETGNLSWPEMLQIFNCGIGYILVVPQKDAQNVLKMLHEKDVKAWEIGKIVSHNHDERVHIDF